MKTFKVQACQGDMMLMRVDAAQLPANAEEIPAQGGHHILAYSETGHHHVLEATPGLAHYKGMDVLKSFLVVPDGPALPIKHLREAHTHETIWLEPGTYMVARQREFDHSEGWRLAAD